jgi:hypothetical protein
MTARRSKMDKDYKPEGIFPVLAGTTLCWIILVLVVLMATSCASVVGVATKPGKDSRCFTGMGLEFCYERERTEDGVQRSDTEDD